MPKLTFSQLEPIKLPIVTRFYKEYYPAGKPKRDEIIFLTHQEHTLIGSVRFKTIDRYRLLTGMLVHPEYRQQGIGHQLMAFCSQNTDLTGCYCFAFEHLVPFYSQHGFQVLENHELPPSLLGRFNRYSNSGKSLCAMIFIPNP